MDEQMDQGTVLWFCETEAGDTNDQFLPTPHPHHIPPDSNTKSLQAYNRNIAIMLCFSLQSSEGFKRNCY